MQNVGLLKFGGRTAGAVIEWPRSLNYGNAGRLHETKTTPSAVLQKKCAQMFKIQKSEKMFWLFGLFRMTCGSQLLMNISKCYDTPSPNKLIYRMKSNTYVQTQISCRGLVASPNLRPAWLSTKVLQNCDQMFGNQYRLLKLFGCWFVHMDRGS